MNMNTPTNDNGTSVAAAAKSNTALTALTALTTTLNGVDTRGVASRSGRPMLQFKARDNNGTWFFGHKRTIPEAGSSWAANPTTFQRGYICWGDGNKKLGERLLPVSQPMPNIAELPDLGFKWQEEWAVGMKCLGGIDSGTEVVFTMSTDGGIQAITGLLDTVRDRLNGGQHDGKIAPIVLLEKESYPHPQYGKTWKPLLTIVEWMPLDGPAPVPVPAPASPPPPTSPPPASADEQPRRRRVV
jgi:hypothetical protein